MSELEQNELTIRIKAADEEEKAIMLKLFPDELLWNELRRRDQIKTNMLNDIKSTLKMEETDESKSN